MGENVNNVISAIRQELIESGDEKTQKAAERFFKEKIKSYGVATPKVVKIGKKYFADVKDNSKDEIFGLCNELWQSGYIEESIIASNWSYGVRKDYKYGDLKVFEKWINKYVSNWASCDTLCNHTVGEFLEMYPLCVSVLIKWAKSKNRWMRRAASVSLIIPAKHGRFLNNIMEIADILLLDKDDLVQKGYCWMLKSASQAHQKEIFDYVMQNKTMMPRTALRYAIEKLPAELKARAMKRSITVS
jgi:3-methyladenine DNA glycosylase AlkD